MEYLGLDIGTTSISCAVMKHGKLLFAKTMPNSSTLPAAKPWEHIQDADIITDTCLAAYRDILQAYPTLSGIGLTGQMHGILYVDASGRAASPLFTWQDGRGNLPYPSGQSHCDYMQTQTGYFCATGFGLVTHYCNLRNGLVPANATSFCTIADYVAMRLCTLAKPLLHPSMAASLGLYDLRSHTFDLSALATLQVNADILPAVCAKERILGHTADGVPIFIPIGDNQASFLGAVDKDDRVLVNIGTGSQISVASRTIPADGSLECRPFVDGQYLLLGAALCGGSAYQLLRNFFTETLCMAGAEAPENLYESMERAALDAFEATDHPIVDTRFRGSRKEPALRGSVQNLGPDTFTPGQLSLGVLQGICSELKSYYNDMPAVAKQAPVLVASGNAVRNNRLLRTLLAECFQKEVYVPQHREEAAFGAALLAQRSGSSEYSSPARYKIEYMSADAL